MADPAPTQHLVALDVQGIQSYVFASAKLREMVGASILVERLGSQLLPRIAERRDGEPVVNAGGGGLVLFSGDDSARRARAFGRELRADYAKTTVIGRLVASEPIAVDGDFPAAYEAALDSLEERKRAAPEAAAEPLTGPHLLRCWCCGAEAAEHEDEETPADERAAPAERWIGPACAAKREARRDGRSDRAWLRDLRGRRGREEKLRDVDSFEDLAGERDYLGLVVADGDAVGTRIRELLAASTTGDPAGRLRDFAEGMSGAMRASLVKALDEALPPPPADLQPVPAQVLIAGGDDVLAVLRGREALPFARQVTGELRRQTASLETGALGMSAAVLLTRPGFPVRRGHQLAEALLRRAKREARVQGWEEGALHFAVVSEASADLAAVESESWYGMDEEDGDGFRLTGRPYRLAEDGGRSAPALFAAATELARAAFPRSKLHHLRRVFTRSWLLEQGFDPRAEHPQEVEDARDLLTREYRYWRSRVLRSSGLAERWRSVEAVLGLSPNDPWFRDDDRRSPLADLSDAVSFVEEAR